MPLSVSFIKLLDRIEPELRDIFIAFYEEIERQRVVSKDEFNELKNLVEEVAKNINKLSEWLEEFKRENEENFNKVWEVQRKTEENLESFRKTGEENFSRVWKSINELVEAQKRNEKEIEKLTRSIKSIRSEIGGLAHTVGYRLEDEAIKALPALLARDMGVEVIGKLRRDFIEVSPGRYVEVNILGEGRRNGQEYIIIGEAKSQLKKRDIDDFIKKASAIRKYIPKEQIQILITYQTSPDVRRYASEKGIKIYFSYEIYI